MLLKFSSVSLIFCINIIPEVPTLCYDNGVITRSLLRYCIRSIKTDPMDV
ncbi:hypothetical protein HanPSC8_Chr08g0313481 [Helianthus annuus]|nr:hypothetical protein HanPSC8_Chr08g0313481 [Helianthus annuus]